MLRTKREKVATSRRALAIAWNCLGVVVLSLFCASGIASIIRIGIGEAPNALVFFLFGQGSVVILVIGATQIPVLLGKFRRWRAWRRRVIKEDRPPTEGEIEEAFLEALEKLTGIKPNKIEISRSKQRNGVNVFGDGIGTPRGTA